MPDIDDINQYVIPIRAPNYLFKYASLLLVRLLLPSMPSLMFPSVGKQVLSSLIHFLGVSILAHCLSRRLATERLTTLEGLRSLTWPRLCVLLVFLDSWLFLFSSGVLIFGVGLELHLGVCSAAILSCVGFYATSKLLIYAFLIERVYIVWAPAGVTKRFRSPVYILCFVTVCCYAIVIGLLLVGRVHFLRKEDNVCLIGLKPLSSYPLLIYDLYINIFLTALFLFPLLRATTVNPRTRRIARRALMAAAVALTTSSTNIVVLALVGGNELGWVCLGSCGADVIINALVLFWVTSKRTRTNKTYVADPHNKVISQPARSIPRPPSTTLVPEAFSPTTSQYTSGPHRITSTYYHVKTVSVASSSHAIASQLERGHPLYPQDPTHPFARATYMPSKPEPEVRISTNPDPTMKAESSSAFRSLIDIFRKNPTAEESPEDIQITVTTDIEIESFHNSILSEEDEDAIPRPGGV